MSSAAKAEQSAGYSSKVIPGRNVTIFDPHAAKPAPAPVPPKAPPPAAASEPRVRLIKDGDVVTAIEILCSCGEVIHLNCEY